MYPVPYFRTTRNRTSGKQLPSFLFELRERERPMKRTLPPESLNEIATRLEQAHKAFQRRYPGQSGDRQPIHVVYGGAHLFRAGTTRRLGDLALRSLEEYASDFRSLRESDWIGRIGSPADLARRDHRYRKIHRGRSTSGAARKPTGVARGHCLSPRARETSPRTCRRFPARFRGWLRQPPR